MFHPVGSQPPSVYWRRRLVLIGAAVLVIVLLAITISTLSGGDGRPTASPTTGSHTTPRHTPSTTPRTTASSTHSSAPSTGNTSQSPMPTTCALSDLQIKAMVGKSTYAVGASPLVELQVINVGNAPCTRDLSDKQIELRVYNGTSRVWGSHDCAVQPGSDVRTLAVGKPYRFAILWGGLTSAPHCSQNTRQRVGAGSYTLYASLSGRSASAAQFEIS